jgi:hypothetical protein
MLAVCAVYSKPFEIVSRYVPGGTRTSNAPST